MFDSVLDSDIEAPFNHSDAAKLAARLGVEFDQFTLQDFMTGLNTELEHRSATGGDPTDTAAIVLEHLAEHPHYYRGLKDMENKLEQDKPQDKSEADEQAAELLGVDPEQVDNAISSIFEDVTAEQIVSDLTKLAAKLEATGHREAAEAIDNLTIRTAAGLRDWAAKKMREWSGSLGKRVENRVNQTATTSTTQTKQDAGLDIDSANGVVRITRRSEFLPKFKAGLITVMGLSAAIKGRFAQDADMLTKIRIAESATDGSAANRLLDIAVEAGLLLP